MTDVIARRRIFSEAWAVQLFGVELRDVWRFVSGQEEAQEHLQCHNRGAAAAGSAFSSVRVKQLHGFGHSTNSSRTQLHSMALSEHLCRGNLAGRGACETKGRHISRGSQGRFYPYSPLHPLLLRVLATRF